MTKRYISCTSKAGLEETLNNADSKTNLSLKLRLEDKERGNSTLGLALDKK
jgi:Tfp pilus assembly ATPase PilU